jgi:hypothetical protein
VDLPAEQLIDRLAHRLADDVPARRLDAREDAQKRRIRPLRVARGIDDAPQRLDVEGIAADDDALADILDHLGDDVGMERHGIDLAHALDPVISLELDEDPVEPAEMRRRIADDEGLEVGDLHARRSSPIPWAHHPAGPYPGARGTVAVQDTGRPATAKPESISQGTSGGRAP